MKLEYKLSWMIRCKLLFLLTSFFFPTLSLAQNQYWNIQFESPSVYLREEGESFIGTFQMRIASFVYCVAKYKVIFNNVEISRGQLSVFQGSQPFYIKCSLPLSSYACGDSLLVQVNTSPSLIPPRLTYPLRVDWPPPKVEYFAVVKEREFLVEESNDSLTGYLTINPATDCNLHLDARVNDGRDQCAISPSVIVGPRAVRISFPSNLGEPSSLRLGFFKQTHSNKKTFSIDKDFPIKYSTFYTEERKLWLIVLGLLICAFILFSIVLSNRRRKNAAELPVQISKSKAIPRQEPIKIQTEQKVNKNIQAGEEFWEPILWTEHNLHDTFEKIIRIDHSDQTNVIVTCSEKVSTWYTLRIFGQKVTAFPYTFRLGKVFDNHHLAPFQFSLSKEEIKDCEYKESSVWYSLTWDNQIRKVGLYLSYGQKPNPSPSPSLIPDRLTYPISIAWPPPKVEYYAVKQDAGTILIQEQLTKSFPGQEVRRHIEHLDDVVAEYQQLLDLPNRAESLSHPTLWDKLYLQPLRDIDNIDIIKVGIMDVQGDINTLESYIIKFEPRLDPEFLLITIKAGTTNGLVLPPAWAVYKEKAHIVLLSLFYNVPPDSEHSYITSVERPAIVLPINKDTNEYRLVERGKLLFSRLGASRQTTEAGEVPIFITANDQAVLTEVPHAISSVLEPKQMEALEKALAEEKKARADLEKIFLAIKNRNIELESQLDELKSTHVSEWHIAQTQKALWQSLMEDCNCAFQSSYSGKAIFIYEDFVEEVKPKFCVEVKRYSRDFTEERLLTEASDGPLIALSLNPDRTQWILLPLPLPDVRWTRPDWKKYIKGIYNVSASGNIACIKKPALIDNEREGTMLITMGELEYVG